MAATKTKRRTSRSRLNGPLPEAADTTQVLTLTEAAVFLRVSEAALLRSATLQEVPGRKIGNEWRFLTTACNTGWAPLRREGGC